MKKVFQPNKYQKRLIECFNRDIDYILFECKPQKLRTSEEGNCSVEEPQTI